MKKLLLILLCLPFMGFGQENNVRVCAFEEFLENGEKNVRNIFLKDFKMQKTKNNKSRQMQKQCENMQNTWQT